MPHLAGRCSCGRRIRFQSGATYGATWECWKCGTVWTLAERGEPLRWGRSKAPESAGCMLMIIAAAICFALLSKAVAAVHF